MREYLTNCCESYFTFPDWPDSDTCSKCKEHATLGLIIGDEND